MADRPIPLRRLDKGAHDDRPLAVRLMQRGARWRVWAAAAVWYVLVVLLLSPLLRYRSHEYRQGELAAADVSAPRGIAVEDRVATVSKRQRLEETRPRVWVHDSGVEATATSRLDGFIQKLDSGPPQNPQQMRIFMSQLEMENSLALDESTIDALLPSRLRSLHPPLALKDVAEKLRLIIQFVLGSKGVVYQLELYQSHFQSKVLDVVDERGRKEAKLDPNNLLRYPDEMREFLQNVELPRNFPGEQNAELRQACFNLLDSLIKPNLRLDEDRTRQRFAEVMAGPDYAPVSRRFDPGAVIVSKGEILSPVQADALNLLDSEARIRTVDKLIGVMLIVAVFFAAVALYLKRFRREVTLDAATVTLHALPPIMGIAMGQTLILMNYNPDQVMLGFPAAMVGLLSALLLTPQVAFVLVLVCCALFGISTQQDFSFLIFSLFGGFSAIMAGRSVRVRGQMLVVGMQVGAVNAFTVVMLGYLTAGETPGWRPPVYAFLNGLICALATMLWLVIFEKVFDVVTDIRLLELTGIKNKLIAEFEEKAPGSYQHVLSVTKLAEAGAEAIGANVLLVRAGAYFHDVGKMIKPKYYSENQVTLEDKKVHSRLSPYMSVLIIKNHVKEGIELARKAGLPEKIVEFIPQHHGTSLIRYFYAEALRRYEDSEAVDPVHEEDFRYPGPKPQSIEAAVVLLADSVEAIASSKFVGGQVNENELRRVVQAAISEKFNDGQFDECDLTMRHLYLLREAYVRALMARYHFRIAYPTAPKRETVQPVPAASSAA